MTIFYKNRLKIRDTKKFLKQEFGDITFEFSSFGGADINYIYHANHLEQSSAVLMQWMFKKHIKEFGYTLFSVYKNTHLYTIKPLERLV